MEPRQVILTKDGSHSISLPAAGLTYHSTHGAIQESKHVFIEAGLHKAIPTGSLKIFEMGLGTGLNALLTLMEPRPIFYECVETFPLDADIIQQLNYCDLLGRPDLQPAFEKIHNSNWEEEVWITESFCFKKHHTPLQDYLSNTQFHVIYFDAFAPDAQPELWTKEVFEKMYAMLLPGGILTTYSSKGIIRRNLLSAGFVVEKIPGPPGKREMVRAMKPGSPSP